MELLSTPFPVDDSVSSLAWKLPMEIYDIIMLVVLARGDAVWCNQGICLAARLDRFDRRQLYRRLPVSRAVQPIDPGRSALESIPGDADSLHRHIAGDLGRLSDDQRLDRPAEAAGV